MTLPIHTSSSFMGLQVSSCILTYPKQASKNYSVFSMLNSEYLKHTFCHQIQITSKTSLMGGSLKAQCYSLQ